ncbi:7-carboxy-7-deazaguanine synthase QueE [Alteromonas oceanisediminis]|uniref:7-carboxy-7-deazaguanine synthase QueE n=1 Tax=Alteromonas oceanisediminis TaxID=2836180 RepID=UPI001BDAA1DA|nr:7-carboxy-7-deazaguanine synthase QueE [Alteromonas oceanisediminis]MBT0584799.1 7-carboxy-7-deazaguanine synthase QueE [Alteromonas oceanisediminis]
MLKVNEIFQTIQGEGVFTGAPAIFVRLQGCPVGCPWCDTQHTWEVALDDKAPLTAVTTKTADSAAWSDADTQEILAIFAAQGYTAKHIVITGGEPCMYDLTGLTSTLYELGYSTQIETSGTFDILCHSSTWVTVSPKIDMPGGYPILATAMQRANEIKHPIAMQKHIDLLDNLLANMPVANDTVIALQPISQKPRATELAINTCIERNWRLSLQTHKYLGIE